MIRRTHLPSSRIHDIRERVDSAGAGHAMGDVTAGCCRYARSARSSAVALHMIETAPVQGTDGIGTIMFTVDGFCC